MIVKVPNFWEYAIFGKDGFWNGKIKENAPIKAKKEYEEFIKQKNNAEKEGIRL